MVKRPPQLAHGTIERDLARLTGDRVGQAMRSVLQVADGNGQVTCIAFAGVAAALAAAVGAMRAAGKIDRSMDEISAARVILDIMEETARG